MMQPPVPQERISTGRKTAPKEETDLVALELAKIIAPIFDKPKKAGLLATYANARFEHQNAKTRKKILEFYAPQDPGIAKLEQEIKAYGAQEKKIAETYEKTIGGDIIHLLDQACALNNQEVRALYKKHNIMITTDDGNGQMTAFCQVLVTAAKECDTHEIENGIRRKKQSNEDALRKALEADNKIIEERQKQKSKEPPKPEVPDDMQAALERFRNETLDATHLPHKVRGDETPEQGR